MLSTNIASSSTDNLFQYIKKLVLSNNLKELQQVDLSQISKDEMNELIELAIENEFWEIVCFLKQYFFNDNEFDNLDTNYETDKHNQKGVKDKYVQAKDTKHGKIVGKYCLTSGNSEYFINLKVAPSPYTIPIIDIDCNELGETQFGVNIEKLDQNNHVEQLSFSKFDLVFPKSEHSLQTLLNNKALPCKAAFKWILQLIQGVQFLHRQGFVHRNIKPFHVHVYKDPVTGDKSVKLGATWGACPIGYKGEVYGSSEIQAPEISHHDDEEDFEYWPSLDIYLLGCTLAELMNIVILTEHELELVNAFINRMKHENPMERPDIDECYEFFHDLFQSMLFPFSNKFSDCVFKSSQ